MLNFNLFFLIYFIYGFISFAQEKMLTMEDAVIKSYTTLAPSNLKQLKWISHTEEFSYVDDSNENISLVKESINSPEKTTILTLKNLNEKLNEYDVAETTAFPSIKWNDKNSFRFWIKQKLFYYQYVEEKLSLINQVSEEAKNKSVAPNNIYAAFTKDNHLFLSIAKDKIKQITFDEDKDIVSGQSVHRNEFGIRKGIFWSPKSNYLAYYRMDQTMVTDYPIVDISTVPASLKNTKYPMAGQLSHHVTIGIYNIKTEETFWLKTGEPLDQYLTCVTWGPDEEFIYVAHLNRDQNHMRLIKYEAATGDQIKILFEERDEQYVEPEHSLIFLPNQKDKFLWFSERDGWNHLYLYNTGGELLKQVTEGKWEVLSFDGFDKNEENIFITSIKDSPVERHYYKINMQNVELKNLTKESGTHKIKSNHEKTYFIDSFNSLEIPRRINLVNLEGKNIRTIHESDNPVKDYKLGETKIFTITGENDLELFCKMVLPPEFDSNKKYPVIVYVYGGPHDQQVTNYWPFGRYDFWFNLMAQKNYIIFILDNRGSAHRGLEFEQATFRKLGTNEIEDQMRGVEYLKSLEYVDGERLGVYGWSYGGYMATSLMLRTNGTFKVGVGGGSVIDWKLYEVMYTERYMDTPETNTEGYEEANLLNYIDNLNGKLLLVHGTEDPVVVWQQDLLFAQKAANLNKPLDYYPYPGHKHGVRGKDVVHLYNKITNYFLDNL